MPLLEDQVAIVTAAAQGIVPAIADPGQPATDAVAAELGVIEATGGRCV